MRVYIALNPPDTRIDDSRSTYKLLEITREFFCFAITLSLKQLTMGKMNPATWEETKWLPANPITVVGLRLSTPKSVYPTVLQ
jgi:hypothetical protein